jgi:DNA-binding CsgD family transcriptional regulator
VLERALAEHPDLDGELRRRLEAELIVNATRVPAQYVRVRERLARIDASPDEGPGARVLLAGRAYHDAVGGGDLERAAATALAALTAMSHEERARNYTGGAYALLYAERLDDGVRLLDATLADVRRRGAVSPFSSLSMTRAIFQYARGNLVEAEADGRAALEALPHRSVWFRPAGHGWLAQILVERGLVDEAAELVDAAEASVRADAFSRAPLLRAAALVEAARRRSSRGARARARARRGAGRVRPHNPPASVPAWRSLAAVEQHALGRTQEALGLAHEEVELARAWGAPRTLGRALRICGLVEGGAEGIAHIGKRSPCWSLRRRGSSTPTPSPTSAPRCAAPTPRRGARPAPFGARPRPALRRRPARRACARGADRDRRPPAPDRPSGAASLTPSERRIAAMAAEGLSNRDIAQALFVTLRTVEMHLSNAFRKLAVSSRTQLSAALAD